MKTLALAVLAFQTAATPSVSQDSIRKLRDNARRAEVQFERLVRRLAPVHFGGYDGTRCDERVGRFCLIYDSGRLPDPAPEPTAVTDARRVAIEVLRKAFAFMPADFETAGPLVRYLIEDDRAGEAVPAARLFFAESRDSLWGPLLVGFALHAAQRDTAATRYFDLALPRLDAEERARIASVEWLLGHSDRSAYGRLDSRAKEAFSARLWRLSDPLYVTPGNERANEHIARHVWSRIMAHTPVVQDMVRWGSDLEQLTVRYGIPSSRTRSPGRGLEDGSLTEHYDPDQLAWVPEDLLSNGPSPTPLPGEPWALDATRNRSGYAPATVRRVRPMLHQVSRFPRDGGWTLRVDGLFAGDSLVTGATEVATGLHVLDATSMTAVAIEERLRTGGPDSLPLAFEADLGPGSYVYSVEALETGTRFGVRARYAIPLDSAVTGLRVSDPVLVRAWRGMVPTGRTDPAFRPAAGLTFTRTDTVGIYAEVHGLGRDRRYDVRLSLERATRPSLPSRIASWIGDRLGLHEPGSPPRLQWSADAGPAGLAILAVDLFLDPAGDGLHAVVLEVRDPVSGQTSVSRRILRIAS